MRLSSLLLTLLPPIMCIITLGEAISLNMDFYNSQDSVSMGLSGENLNYGAVAELKPDSLLFENGGSSTQPQCFYDYHVAFDGQTIESGAQTNNGIFSWSTLVDADSKGDGSRTFRVSPSAAVKDGTLKSHYSNSDIKVDTTTIAIKSTFKQIAGITQATLNIADSGKTLKDIDAASSNSKGTNANKDGKATEDTIQGVDQVIRVTGSEKTGSIVTQALGETNVAWVDKVVSNPSETKFGTAIQGTSKYQLSALGMEGKATNFPTQILPPGNVKINSKTQTEQDLENLQKYIDDQEKIFSDKYPQPITKPLWYYLKESAYVNPIPKDPSAPANIPRDYYTMSMNFGMKKY